MFNVSETRIYIDALSLDAKMTQAIHVKKYIILLQRVPVVVVLVDNVCCPEYL